MDERRKLNRKYLAFFTRVFDRGNGQLLGHLADLTSEGMMIISEKPLEIDTVYNLRMDLSGAFFDREQLDFKANGVWCKPDIDPAFFNIGFQLINISSDEISIIHRIIEEYGIRG